MSDTELVFGQNKVRIKPDQIDVSQDGGRSWTQIGGPVGTAGLEDEAVTAAKLAALSVGTGALIDQAVTAAKLADLSVGTGALIDLAVTAAKLADGAVTTAKLADQSVTADKLDPSALLTNHPRLHLTRSAPQAIPSGAVTELAWDTIVADTTDGTWWAVANPSRLKLSPGVYAIELHVWWAANATGTRGAQLKYRSLLGSDNVAAVTHNNAGASAGVSMTLTATYAVDHTLTASEWLFLGVSQTSGGAMNVAAVAGAGGQDYTGCNLIITKL